MASTDSGNQGAGKAGFFSRFGKGAIATVGGVGACTGLVLNFKQISDWVTGAPPPAPTAVEVTLKPAQPSKAMDKNYEKLSNAELSGDLAGQKVNATLTYLGLADTATYCMAVVQEFTEAARFKNRVCINHRDQHYTSGSTAFGSTDVMTPNFAISFPKEQFDPLTETRTHQKLEVSGTVTVVKGITGSKIHLIADSFTVVE